MQLKSLFRWKLEPYMHLSEKKGWKSMIWRSISRNNKNAVTMWWIKVKISLIPYFRRKAFNISPLQRMFALGFTFCFGLGTISDESKFPFPPSLPWGILCLKSRIKCLIFMNLGKAFNFPLPLCLLIRWIMPVDFFQMLHYS